MKDPVTVDDGIQRREVATLVELHAWLDALAAVGGPAWVEISGGDGAMLQVALGRDDLSSLRFTDNAAAGPVMVSTGTVPTALGSYDFTDRGLDRAVLAEEAIPVTVARVAVDEFVQSGHRPTAVAWHPADPPGTVPGMSWLWNGRVA
ncbi:MAG: Imm1 family immunity protein [Streptosporangiales bacterium]